MELRSFQILAQAWQIFVTLSEIDFRATLFELHGLGELCKSGTLCSFRFSATVHRHVDFVEVVLTGA